MTKVRKKKNTSLKPYHDFLLFLDDLNFNHSITMPSIMLKQLYLKNTLMKESIRDDSKEKMQQNHLWVNQMRLSFISKFG